MVVLDLQLLEPEARERARSGMARSDDSGLSVLACEGGDD
ncbi:SapB/AmfS family lanthipeptide [Streptomyces sp. NPDC049577]